MVVGDRLVGQVVVGWLLVAIFVQWWWWALVAVVGWQKGWVAVACGCQSDEDDER